MENYFYSNGYMAYNTTIDGYILDSNGAWSQIQESESANEDPMNRTIDEGGSSFDAETQLNISQNN